MIAPREHRLAELERSSTRVVVLGCGAVGAAVGAALVTRGMTVVLYDISPHRRAFLASGLVEYGDDELVSSLREAQAAGRLCVADDVRPHDGPSHFIVCTPTPVDAAGRLDTTAIESAMSTIASAAQPDDAVLIRSTVSIGTTRRLAGEMLARGLDLRFAATPDRSIEGRSFADQFAVPHLVGGLDDLATTRASALLAPLGEVINVGSAEAAEAAKLFGNVWRATLFAAANTMAIACESLGLDMHTLVAAASRNYPRFSPPPPGPVGGPCLPKDVRLLASSLAGEASALMSGVTRIEAHMFSVIADALDSHLACQEREVRVALLGIAFKGYPAVDDARGSVAVALARHLRARWAKAVIVGWDPVMSASQVRAAGLMAAPSPKAAAARACLVVVCNTHPALAGLAIDDLAHASEAGALLYDIAGVTLPHGRSLPNGMRRHVLGRGTPAGRITDAGGA